MALEDNIREAERYHQSGMQCYNNGNIDGAIENWEKAVELNPDFTEAHFNLGFAYQFAYLKKEERQTQELHRGQEENEDGSGFGEVEETRKTVYETPTTQVLRGIIEDHERLPRWEKQSEEMRRDLFKAIDKFRKVIGLDPNNAKAYASLASIYWWHFTSSEAAEYLEKAIKLDPENKEYRQSLKRVKKGPTPHDIQMAEIEREDKEEFERDWRVLGEMAVLEHNVKEFGGDVDSYYDLIMGYRELGETDEATKTYFKNRDVFRRNSLRGSMELYSFINRKSSIIGPNVFIELEKLIQDEMISDLRSFGSKDPRDLVIPHQRRTDYWLMKINPDASFALHIAALLHDIERLAVERIKKTDFPAYEDYKKRHAAYGATLAGHLLKRYGVDKETKKRVKRLIKRHETGGDLESNCLMDADTLSFFETNLDLYFKMNGAEKTEEKIEFMHNRIFYPRTKIMARPFYKEAYFKLALAYKKERNLEKANQALKKARDIDLRIQLSFDFFEDNYHKTYTGLGLSNILDRIKKAMEIDPKQRKAYNLLNKIYPDNLLFERAVEAYEITDLQKPSDISFFNNSDIPF